MELKHLQTFLVLSKIKNFTKTAEYLHFAQSNITTQIQQLEEELNVKLFERLGRSITLTAKGLELVPYAEKMLTLSDDMKLKFSNQASGKIIIGASESMCIYRLPEIIKVFQAAHPDVELYIKMLDSENFTPMLASNEIDLAFVLDSPITAPSLESALQIDEDIRLFSLPTHPLTKKSKVLITDFSDIPLILTGAGCCYRKMFEKELLDASVKPKIVLETNSLQVIKQTALSGLGICLLPLLAVEKELDEKHLVAIKYATNYKICSQLIHHKDKWISPDMKYLLDTIVDSSSHTK